MVTSQPHRTGNTQAWWAQTGSANRGFVSLDPERQREVDSGPPRPKKRSGTEFSFEVRVAGARSARPVDRRKGQRPPEATQAPGAGTPAPSADAAAPEGRGARKR